MYPFSRSTPSMRRAFLGTALSLLVTLALSISPTAQAADAASAPAWVASWAANPHPTWGPDFPFPTRIPAQLNKQTLRQVVRISQGGDRLRIELSNAYGKQPLVIGAATVALVATNSSIVPHSVRNLTFGGQTSATILPGAPLLSDPVALATPALSKLAVSLYLPQATPTATFHWDGLQTAWIVPGNQVQAPRIATEHNTSARIWLSGVQVETAATTPVIATLGDSITDGNASTLDANQRWPDALAQRLVPQGVAVVNAGISGARLLSDGMGSNALARYERDVLGQPGVRAVIVMLGINDIGWPGTVLEPQATPPSVASMIAAYQQLITRAHSHGLRIVGATLAPFANALPDTPLGKNYYQADKEVLRQQVNTWIRDSGAFDAVIDFDAVLRQPEQPNRIKPEFDSGDHLHPSNAGYRAMAQAIDLHKLLPEQTAATRSIR